MQRVIEPSESSPRRHLRAFPPTTSTHCSPHSIRRLACCLRWLERRSKFTRSLPSIKRADLYGSKHLGEGHRLDGFSCGQPVLDGWLVGSARRSELRDNTRTFVWEDEDQRVVAYFTILPHTIRRDELPTRIGRGDLNEIPAILLARLALDESLQGVGLGAQLLVDALGRIVGAVEIAGGRYIVVDAINDDAIDFYQHFGFTQSPVTRFSMFMRVKDARTSL